jgi:hypothetical protein
MAITNMLPPDIGRDPGGRTMKARDTMANGGWEGAEEVGVIRSGEQLIIRLVEGSELSVKGTLLSFSMNQSRHIESLLLMVFFDLTI